MVAFHLAADHRLIFTHRIVDIREMKPVFLEMRRDQFSFLGFLLRLPGVASVQAVGCKFLLRYLFVLNVFTWDQRGKRLPLDLKLSYRCLDQFVVWFEIKLSRI